MLPLRELLVPFRGQLIYLIRVYLRLISLLAQNKYGSRMISLLRDITREPGCGQHHSLALCVFLARAGFLVGSAVTSLDTALLV